MSYIKQLYFIPQIYSLNSLKNNVKLTGLLKLKHSNFETEILETLKDIKSKKSNH